MLERRVAQLQEARELDRRIVNCVGTDIYVDDYANYSEGIAKFKNSIKAFEDELLRRTLLSLHGV